MLPLAVGNQWTYHRTIYQPLTGRIERDTVTVRISGTTNIGGLPYYTIQSGYSDIFYGATELRYDTSKYVLRTSNGTMHYFLSDSIQQGVSPSPSMPYQHLSGFNQTLATPMGAYNEVATLQHAFGNSTGIAQITSTTTTRSYQPSIGLVHFLQTTSTTYMNIPSSMTRIELELIAHTIDGQTAVATHPVSNGTGTTYTDPLDTSEISVFGPFGIGSTWEYEKVLYDSSNIFIHGFTSTHTYSGPVSIYNKEYFDQVYHGALHVDGGKHYVRHNNADLQVMIESPSMGDSWTSLVLYPSSSPDYYNYTVVATGQTLTIGANTFNNVVELKLDINSNFGSRQEKQYYQAGIGFLMKTGVRDTDGRRDTVRLLNYNIVP
jgi:hypothetical protein